MKNLLTFVVALLGTTILLRIFQIDFARKLLFIELLGVGVVIAMLSINFMKNKSKDSSFFKFSIYTAVAFFLYSGGLFTINWINSKYSVILLLSCVFIIAGIGAHATFLARQKATIQKAKNRGYVILTIFILHALYSFVVVMGLFKQWDISVIIPIIFVLDIIVIVPYMIVSKAYKQYLLVTVILVSTSVNTLIMPREYISWSAAEGSGKSVLSYISRR